ncbi:MAG: bifunctional nuclease family protein [Akkermansiaceae bacterium]
MKDHVRVEPVALMPTSAGCAVFLGNGEKVIVFYIEPAIGASINAVMSGVKPPRPLTHDLFSQMLDAFGATVQKAVIVKVEGDVYYARLHVVAENEIMERKVIEIDARPSDCLALAVRQEAPVFVREHVWDELRDMSDVLAELKDKAEE